MNDHALIKQALGHMREYALILTNEYGAKININDTTDLEGEATASVILDAENDYLLVYFAIWSHGTGDFAAFELTHNDYLFHDAFEFQTIEEIIARSDRIVTLFRDLKPLDDKFAIS